MENWLCEYKGQETEEKQEWLLNLLFCSVESCQHLQASNIPVNHDVHFCCRFKFICLFIYLLTYFIVVQLPLSKLFPHYSPLSYPPPPSPFSPLPALCLSMGPLYNGPSPLFPCYPLAPSPQLLSVCSLFPDLNLNVMYFPNVIIVLAVCMSGRRLL